MRPQMGLSLNTRRSPGNALQFLNGLRRARFRPVVVCLMTPFRPSAEPFRIFSSVAVVAFSCTLAGFVVIVPGPESFRRVSLRPASASLADFRLALRHALPQQTRIDSVTEDSSAVQDAGSGIAEWFVRVRVYLGLAQARIFFGTGRRTPAPLLPGKSVDRLSGQRTARQP